MGGSGEQHARSCRLTFTLPWPPSINSMYQQGNHRRRAQEGAGVDVPVEGRQGVPRRGDGGDQRAAVPKNALRGRLAVVAIALPPDARVRDLDNLWKSALDCLKHNSIITDDGHIDDLHIRRGPERKGGQFLITISEIAEAFESRQQGLELAAAADATATPQPRSNHREHS
jgi:crossover junction endodeoxyribonuclease RusA